MMPRLYGMPVRIIHNMAKLQLSEHVMVTPEFREEFNAWLKDMFPANVMPDNQVINAQGIFLMNPRTWASIEKKLRGQ